jgi:hypothetical protein
MNRSLKVDFLPAPLLVRVVGLFGGRIFRAWGLTLDEARDLRARLDTAIAAGETYMKANPDARRPEDRAVSA